MLTRVKINLHNRHMDALLQCVAQAHRLLEEGDRSLEVAVLCVRWPKSKVISTFEDWKMRKLSDKYSLTMDIDVAVSLYHLLGSGQMYWGIELRNKIHQKIEQEGWIYSKRILVRDTHDTVHGKHSRTICRCSDAGGRI